METPEKQDSGRDLDDFPYRRPAVSSWIAAASVAFAFFVLGGYIKTYRQLQELRAETRREIAELRQDLGRFRESPPIRASAPFRPVIDPSPVAPAIERLPDITLDGERPPGLDEPAVRAPVQSHPEGRSRVGLAIVGQSDVTPEARLSQVIALGASNTLMIEGGRDQNREENTTLALYRDGKKIGELRVIRVFDAMASCEIVNASLVPQPGDPVRLITE